MRPPPTSPLAGDRTTRHTLNYLPSQLPPSSTAHEYLSFPLLLSPSDEDLSERGLGQSGLVDHLVELGPVVDAPALRLVHVLADDHVAVLVSMVSQRPKLSGHREVHVLAVAGYPGVGCPWRGFASFTHLRVFLLVPTNNRRSRHKPYEHCLLSPLVAEPVIELRPLLPPLLRFLLSSPLLLLSNVLLLPLPLLLFS